MSLMDEGSRTTSQPAPLAKLTYNDFLLFPDDGERHELVGGDHYVTPSPSLRHQTISGRLHRTIGRYLDDHPVGEIWAAPLDVVLSQVDVVEPDLIYVSNARASVLTKQNIQGVPDLVVEILSPNTRKMDEVVKRRAYERFGVPEYWVVDPELNLIKVYVLRDARFERAAEFLSDEDAILTTSLFPGLNLDLRTLFR